ncbi:hypothetical protein EVAR_94135_1 [Eumeta japonica]|uniref:Uncharacterized protein n=1 Tax=Eumeta variegata TaxID=151549 RepID=A0A4C1U8A5_EUMVA|nr:hypothetical protein EVAR_94135_1 [Eumeta japonica]
MAAATNATDRYQDSTLMFFSSLTFIRSVSICEIVNMSRMSCEVYTHPTAEVYPATIFLFQTRALSSLEAGPVRADRRPTAVVADAMAKSGADGLICFSRHRTRIDFSARASNFSLCVHTWTGRVFLSEPRRPRSGNELILILLNAPSILANAVEMQRMLKAVINRRPTGARAGAMHLKGVRSRRPIEIKFAKVDFGFANVLLCLKKNPWQILHLGCRLRFESALIDHLELISCMR